MQNSKHFSKEPPKSSKEPPAEKAKILYVLTNDFWTF